MISRAWFTCLAAWKAGTQIKQRKQNSALLFGRQAQHVQHACQADDLAVASSIWSIQELYRGLHKPLAAAVQSVMSSGTHISLWKGLDQYPSMLSVRCHSHLAVSPTQSQSLLPGSHPEAVVLAFCKLRHDEVALQVSVLQRNDHLCKLEKDKRVSA